MRFFFFQAEDGIRDFCLSRGLGDVYKRQLIVSSLTRKYWLKIVSIANAIAFIFIYIGLQAYLPTLLSLLVHIFAALYLSKWWNYTFIKSLYQLNNSKMEEAENAKLLDNLTEGILVVDTSDHILYTNESFKELFSLHDRTLGFRALMERIQTKIKDIKATLVVKEKSELTKRLISETHAKSIRKSKLLNAEAQYVVNLDMRDLSLIHI
eukprot:TRINITY_DN19932_c0_g1_i2.p1 TRINITY_DN19932_c0_g1~~TRINITY_DN19932_c0_g1_i2.p1  ORF type:complete len:209 (+),score=35.93 TRINITY_DN19932_c0_g1_i2:61-687(+)